MVPSPCQCPGFSGKVCNCFLQAKDNDLHRHCTTCRGKTCDIEDRCEDCQDWSDEKCRRVGEYLAKLSAQHEKKHERKGKVYSSSSSFLGFFPSMPVPLCNLPSPVCSGIVTTTLSLAACSVTYSAATPIVSAAPFVPLSDVMPLEPSRKWRWEDSFVVGSSPWNACRVQGSVGDL